MTVADVALDVRAGGTGAVYTYRAEFAVSPGDAVMVPLGPRTSLGFVVRVREETTSAEAGTFKLKSILSRVEGFGLPEPLLRTLEFVAEEYLCPFPVALSAATPPGVLERLANEWTLTEKEPKELTRSQQEAYETIRDAGGTLTESPTKKLPAASKRTLSLLVQKGLVERRLAFSPFSERRKAKGLFRLPSDGSKVERFLTKEGKRKPAQALTLMRMQAANASALSAMEVKALSGVTDQTLNSLVTAGLLELVEEGTQGRKTPPEPNDEQLSAIRKLVDSVESRAYRPFLLYGITGSGKTEVFLRAAAACLRTGRQVLYLVPEIALAAQAIGQLRDRFGDRVAVFHSDLTPKERLENWSRVRSGAIPVVLGARSALFAPLANVGLIIIDEEHETSYKQETAPRYHAKTVARKLAEIHGATLVLGSATPSVETYAEAIQGSLTLLSLTNRAVTAARLPEVFVDDLGEGYRTGQPAILAPLLQEKIEATLGRGEQGILFLNRRAYAPFLLCRDCGEQFMCPRCAVSLSYSRFDRTLRCHHCGHREPPPDVCPACEGIRLSPIGIGTEKVEEAVRELFPTARVARLDRDVARRKGALESILAEFRAGEIDLLVGTQMVAKGLDFPNVTLVGVIAADVSLNLPDFRASERTFQLLSQVAGRAGRGARPGEVVIQTFSPHHPAVECAQAHDFETLFKILHEERETAGYPPFRRLVNVLLSSESQSLATDSSFRAAIELENLEGAEVLGPTDAVLSRLHNRWRRQLLVKLPPFSPARLVGERLAGLSGKDLQVILDVDPYSMT